MEEIRLTCRCGQTAMTAAGRPIIAAECHCTSCRTAAGMMGALPDAVPERVPTGGTQFVLQRKDRVTFADDQDGLRCFRLTPNATTRRVIATCCNTPMFLEFAAGHWLSLYAARWPDGERPAMDLRTMTKDRISGDPLPDDMPNPKSHTASFMFRLLGAWVAMGFRNPKITAGQKEMTLHG